MTASITRRTEPHPARRNPARRPRASMRPSPLRMAFTLIEPGPVVLVTTRDGERNNIMTISWTMVVDFTPRFAITTGAWNYSFRALKRTRECVIAIPTADQLDEVVGIGTCSGADTDKFAKFGLTPTPGKLVAAPLIRECLANIECRVIDIVRKHDIVVLEGIAAHVAASPRERRTLHAVGDGTFVVDGRKLDRRRQMAAKVPAGARSCALRPPQVSCPTPGPRPFERGPSP